jgi:hypothetical protein
MKVSADIAAMTTKDFDQYTSLYATALAGAHARCGDPIQISGYLGKSDVFEAEVLQSGRVVAIPCLSEEQHSA